MDMEKVLNLAKLARIELGDKEAQSLALEFDAILRYVGEVKTVNSVNNFDKREFPAKNVMREDTNPHESGIYTKAILEQAPVSAGGYIKVKKIL